MVDNRFSISMSVDPVEPIKADRPGPLRSLALFSDLSRRGCADIASAAAQHRPSLHRADLRAERCRIQASAGEIDPGMHP
jgi:hypothetical protein